MARSRWCQPSDKVNNHFVALALFALVGPIAFFYVLLLVRYDSGYRVPAAFGGDWLSPAGPLLLLVLWLLYMVPRYREYWRAARRRLLVGQKGLAEWSITDGWTVILWAEVGTVWPPFDDREDLPDHRFPRIVSLRSSSGSRWRFFALYKETRQINERLQGLVLHQQMGTEPPQVLAPEARTTVVSVEIGPWLESELAWQVEPFERVHRVEPTCMFWLVVEFIAWMVLGSVAISLAFTGLGFWVQARYPGAGIPVGLLVGLPVLFVYDLVISQRSAPLGTVEYARLVRGAGGIVVWLAYRQWLYRWCDLMVEADVVAQTRTSERARVFARLLVVRLNQEQARLPLWFIFEDGNQIAERLLEERNLRG